MGTELGNAEVGAFSDGENFVSIYETVRGSDVFVVQSTSSPVNDNLMELLIMIDALKRASAGRITAVMPYFGYARQDRKTKPRDPISAKLVANLITRAGADRVLTMDLHANQIQGFFDIPVDNLLGNPIFTNYLHDRFNGRGGRGDRRLPDVGSVARARAFAQKLGMGLAIVDKRRQKANSSEVMNIIGDVRGKKVILFDDMVDTAGSLCGAAQALVELGGAVDVIACASHGVLSGPAVERIEKSVLKEVYFLDTVPPRLASPATRSSISPWPTCLPRPSSASTRKCLSRNSLYKTDRIVQIWRGRSVAPPPLPHGGKTLFLTKIGAGAEWLVVGLGNPGEKYENTRHNVGFLTVDELAERARVPVQKLKHRALTNTLEVGSVKVLLMKPVTYMNLSGEAVGRPPASINSHRSGCWSSLTTCPSPWASCASARGGSAGGITASRASSSTWVPTSSPDQGRGGPEAPPRL